MLSDEVEERGADVERTAIVTLGDLFPEGLSGWQIVHALLSVLIGWLLSRLARKGVLKLAARTPGISDSVSQLLRASRSTRCSWSGSGSGWRSSARTCSLCSR